jgi:outer membrane receptor protein involved in Fe transport
VLAAALLVSFLRFGDPEQARIRESVTVTAPDVQRVAVSATATVLTRDALDSLPAFTLDQKLGTTPGFSLFRRASSRTANPTTQGVTLRGLSASGASRTLVMADEVTLNDPFGGWVYWNRIPAAAIERVDVIRGGSSDAFGADALGGAIRIVTRRDTGAAAQIEGGTQRTARVSGYVGRAGALSTFLGLEAATTDGYIPVARESRGAIDTPAGSRYRSAFGRAATDVAAVRVEGGGTWLSEDRGNGTPAQMNATRLASAFGGARGGAGSGFWEARAFRQSQDYDQTFSAVFGGRAAERLTTGQAIDVTATGLDVSWTTFRRAMSVLVSAFGRDVAAYSVARTFNPNGSVLSVAGDLPGQRSAGASAQVLFSIRPRVTASAGIRGERWDLERLRGQTLFAPRGSVSFELADGLVARVSAASSYRNPTQNELFRSFRVGDVLTRSNDALESEQSRGAEAAVTLTRRGLTLRGVAFAARVDGTIYNRTLPAAVIPGVAIVRQRSNGTSGSRGIEVEADARLSRHVRGWLSATAIDSAFTSGELDGNRLPQVPVAHAAAGVRVLAGPWLASFDARYWSRQFDDDRNAFQLRSAATLNALVSMRLRHARIFASVENLLDADIDAGRTPLRTTAQPRTWTVGARLLTR